MKFYLIRHGQTDWNIEGKIQGKTDIPLNEAGIRQARLLAGALRTITDTPGAGVPVIYSSVLIRAVQTAEIIRNALLDRGVAPVRRLSQLREVDFGFWEGLTWSEVEERYPEEFHFWEENPALGTPTGGEKRESCRKRCHDAVEQIVSETESDVILVAHGGILAYVADYLLRSQPERKEIIVTNASISTVEYARDTGEGTLLKLNDTSFLGTDGSENKNKFC